MLPSPGTPLVPVQHWWQPTAALDATRIGGQQYTQAEVREVTGTLQFATRLLPLTTASIALSTGVPGRTVRQVISDMDGRVMLVGKRHNGLYVCQFADEADEYTVALERHWRSERDRVRRRRHFAARLSRRQQQLFDTDALYVDEDEEDE